MRILVFDDSKIHRAAAQAQLKDHDLTVVGTYDEAQSLLTPGLDQEKVSTILRGQFGDAEPVDWPPNPEAEAYAAAKKAARAQSLIYPAFDVVLTDLLVPASRQRQGSDGMAFVGSEMPVGIFIGLMAAVRARVKYIAIFTDSNHHSHPASACLDAFNADGADKPTAFTVEGCKVLLCNTSNWVNRYDPQDLSRALEYAEYHERSDTVFAKNWATLLHYLVTPHA